MAKASGQGAAAGREVKVEDLIGRVMHGGFLCLNPRDGSSWCGRVHGDYESAALCRAEHDMALLRVDPTGNKGDWAQLVVFGATVETPAGRALMWSPGTQEFCCLAHRDLYQRLGIWFDSDEIGDDPVGTQTRVVEALRAHQRTPAAVPMVAELKAPLLGDRAILVAPAVSRASHRRGRARRAA